MDRGVVAEDSASDRSEDDSRTSSVESVYGGVTSVSLTVARLPLHRVFVAVTSFILTRVHLA